MRRKKNNKKTGGAMPDAGFLCFTELPLYVDQPFSVVESITKFCSGVF